MQDEGPVAYAGVDWALARHDVCLIGPAGKVRAERAFPADADGLAAMAAWLSEAAGAEPARIAVAIEVPHGPVVEALLERGFAVHSINPRQLDRFRDRFSPSGAKDDRRDARVLADSLRTDARAFRRLENDDPQVIELRTWSRMASELTEDDVALCNKMRAELLRYYPQVLALSEDPGEAWILDLLRLAPLPVQGRRLTRKRVEDLLREHRIRRIQAEEVREILRRPALTVAPGTAEAASAHLRQLAERVRLVRQQLADCRKQLQAVQTALAAADLPEREGRKDGPRDIEILLSLPGVGRIVASVILAEASRPLRDRDYPALRTLSGVAPVTRRSGKTRIVVMRYACNERLRTALHHAAQAAAQHDPAWKLLYAERRARAQSHGLACRNIADRLLDVLVAMLRTRTLYDPARRAAGKAA